MRRLNNLIMKTFKQYFTEDVDEATFEEYQDIQNNYLSPIDFVNELNSKKIAPLIYRSGESLFDVDIEGIDPTADGKESYYTVDDPEALKQIAAAVAESGDQYRDIAIDIGTGELKDFMLFLPRAGFTGEEFGDMQVFFVEPDGINIIRSNRP